MALLRPQTIESRLPEIGRIRKGGPKRDREKDGKQYQIMGEDLDCFRFDPSPQTYDLPSPDGNGQLSDYLIRQFEELGEKPRTLPIQFLHSTIDQNFTSSNEVWAKVGMVERCVRRCNGETQLLHMIDAKTLSKEPIACSAVEGQNECPNKCKPTGRLSFILPQLKYPGLVVMTTHSIYDIIEIQGNLALYEGWDLNKIPFQLCRTERTINRNEGGTIKPMKKWLCHLVIDPRFGSAVLEAKPKQYLAEITGTTLALESSEPFEAEMVDVEPEPDEAPTQQPRNWGQIKNLTGFTSQEIVGFCTALKIATKPSELSLADGNSLRDRLYCQWAMREMPTIFKAIQHAQNALNIVKDHFPDLGDQRLFDEWTIECGNRIAIAKAVVEA